MLLFILHLVGDFLLQSDWMARNKARSSHAAAAHVLAYTFPFWLILQPTWSALALIAGSHFLIDRFRLARFVVWSKNHLSPPSSWCSWRDCDPDTGFPSDLPQGTSFFLLGMSDATLHLSINYVALRYF